MRRFSGASRSSRLKPRLPLPPPSPQELRHESASTIILAPRLQHLCVPRKVDLALVGELRLAVAAPGVAS